MPTPSTVHGINKPNGNENFTRAAYNAVLDQLDAALRGVTPMTTAQRDALAAGQKWTDRIIRVTDAVAGSEFQRWTGAAWTTDVWSIYALDSDLATHEADTTSVHGIANTANLMRKDIAQTMLGDLTLPTVMQSAAGLTAMRRVSAKAIVTGTSTAVDFDTVENDDFGLWNVANPTRLTIPAGRAGWYQPFGHVTWDAAAGLRSTNGYVNGGLGSSYISEHRHPGGSQVVSSPFGTQAQWLNVGDYFEFVVWQSSGANLNIHGNMRMGLRFIGT